MFLRSCDAAVIIVNEFAGSKVKLSRVSVVMIARVVYTYYGPPTSAVVDRGSAL